MSNDDGQKMEEIRKFSAIYGRFDCKRKPEKPLTLHEVKILFSHNKEYFSLIKTEPKSYKIRA